MAIHYGLALGWVPVYMVARRRFGMTEAPQALCRLMSHGGWRHAEEDRSGAEAARGAAGA